MVEKKEFVVLFRKIEIDKTIEEFIPIQVIEGKYNKKEEWFEDDKKVRYLHIDMKLPNNVVGYGGRTTIEIMKDSLSTSSIEKIKEEMLKYAKKFTYRRDFSQNECIIATDKSNGNQYLFEDVDNVNEQQQEEKEADTDIKLLLTPYEIENKIKTTIKGQDEAIRKIATCIWSTFTDRSLTKKQMLLIGPTGVGKTAIFKKLQKILNIPVIIFSVPGLSQAGYVGRSTDEILKQIYYECDEDPIKMKNCIVILDEIDKISFNKGTNTSDAGNIGVQNELLKIVEGCKRFVDIENGMDTFEIDTSNILFVSSGAFQELYEPKKNQMGFFGNNQQIDKEKEAITTEKLVNYGLKRELVGRFPIKIELNSLTKEVYKEIIISSDESELMSHIRFLASMGIIINNIDEIIDIIIEDAITKGIGARGLVETISNLLLEVIYEVANNPGKYEKVTIGKNILKDPYDFKLVEKQIKKRVKINQVKKG